MLRLCQIADRVLKAEQTFCSLDRTLKGGQSLDRIQNTLDWIRIGYGRRTAYKLDDRV